VGDTIIYAMMGSALGLNFAIGSVAGVLAGAFLGSMVKGHFRWEACEDPRELRRQIVGAAIMGVGAILPLAVLSAKASPPLVFLPILAL